MALPNSSIPVTAGSGRNVATVQRVATDYQVVMVAAPDGHLVGSRADFLCFFTPATNAANRRVADLFNADSTAIVRVRGVWVMPTLSGITGVQIGFGIKRTSAVGTGGTTETPRPLDTTFPALSGSITARSGATGGATVVYTYFQQHFFNDETNAGAGMVGLINTLPVLGDQVTEIVLRQNQGLMVQQDVTATVGLTGAMMYFTVE